MEVDIPFTCHEWLTHAMPKVREAMKHAWYKHGEPTTDVVRGALNLTEEVGEVAEAALEATRPIRAPEGSDVWMNLTDMRHKHLYNMHDELIQVAAYAILLAVKLEGTIRKVERDKQHT